MIINILIIIFVAGLAGENFGTSIAEWFIKWRYADRMQEFNKVSKPPVSGYPALAAGLIVNTLFYLPFVITLILSIVMSGLFINKATSVLILYFSMFALVRGIPTFYLKRKEVLTK